ncbi:hypothetical protein ASE07_25155 [Noviherbaspirillum sp. Root189]|nr:hypothetical protein ASE07_25155 [Noviherbaspirillum sp. Root189]
MRQGIDPVREAKVKNRKAKQESEANVTFEKLFESFMTSRSKKHKPTTAKDYRSTYANHFKFWANTPITEITRKEVQDLFHQITKSSGNAQANKSMRILNVVFNYARGTIHIDGRPLVDNPVSVIKDAGLRHHEVKRETYIHPDQIEAFVKAVIKLGEHPVRDYLFLLLLTGMRSREALSLEWKDVDLLNRVFTVTTEKAKNRQSHTIPMSSLVFRLFVYRYRKNKNESKYVFPSTTGEGHYKEPRPQIAKVIKSSGFEFTPHDLRRTYASILNEVVGSEEIIKRLLNHKSKNITQRYIQTRAEQFRPYVEAVESYIVMGYDWQNLGQIKGFSEQYANAEALEKLLYWSEEEIVAYDCGSMPSIDIKDLLDIAIQSDPSEEKLTTKNKRTAKSINAPESQVIYTKISWPPSK